PCRVDPVPRLQRSVLVAASCRRCGRDALLALRRRRVDLPVRDPLLRGDGLQVRSIGVGSVVAVLAVALLAGCGGNTNPQPAGSIMVTMTEYKFDPSTIQVA